jgi:hypothetical protein
VSLLWPERIALHIGPEALQLAYRGTLDVAKASDWATSLAALPALPRFARVHVSVADRHARYLRLVWPKGLKAAERQAFVDHRFHAVFGPGPWVTQADRDAFGATCLAAALPGELLAALKAWALACRLRITAIEPAFVADYRRSCRSFREDGAFARLETGRVTLGLWHAGKWRALRSQPVEQADGVAAAHCLSALLASLPPDDAYSGGTLHLVGALPPLDLLPAGWTCASMDEAP